MSRLYTPAETLRRLRNRIGHPCTDDYEIRRVFYELFSDPKLKFAYTPYIFQHPLLHRATKHINENWFSDSDGSPLIDRMHCPAPPSDRDYTFPRSRCNLDNESMFYGASEMGVPIFEVQAKKGHYVVISSWAHKLATLTANNRPSQPIEVETIILGAEHIRRSLDVNSDEEKDLYDLLINHEPYFSPSTDQEVRDVDAYIGQVFAEKGSNEVYRFTSTLSNILFNDFRVNKVAPINGLIYPSVESQVSGHNIVLNADFAHNSFKLWGADMYYVQEHDVHQSLFGLRKIKSIKYDPAGKHEWVGVSPADAKKLYWLSPATKRVYAEPMS